MFIPLLLLRRHLSSPVVASFLMNFSFEFVTNCHRKLLNMISRRAKIKLNTQFEYYSNNATNWFIDKPKYSAYMYIYLSISAHLVCLRSAYTDLRSLFQLFFTEVLFARSSRPSLPIRPQLLAGRNVRNQFWSGNAISKIGISIDIVVNR